MMQRTAWPTRRECHVARDETYSMKSIATIKSAAEPTNAQPWSESWIRPAAAGIDDADTDRAGDGICQRHNQGVRPVRKRH